MYVYTMSCTHLKCNIEQKQQVEGYLSQEQHCSQSEQLCLMNTEN